MRFNLIEHLESRRLLSAAVPFHAAINFQPTGAPVPAGYVADIGGTYALQKNGLTYGWTKNTSAQVRDRNSSKSADQRYDTLILMQHTVSPDWNIAVPNGDYTVHLVVGDPTAIDSTYRINVENVLFINAKPTSSTLWFDKTAKVTVKDGKLTISNASGAVDNKICFVDINAVVATPPPPPAPKTVQISAADSSASEANSSTGTFRFTRSGALDQSMTVNFYVTGTATPNQDYKALPHSVVIPAGQSSVDLPVVPINDQLFEPAETVRAVLLAGSYTLGTSQSATITIADDESNSPEKPYGGSPVQVSATIQAEDFDSGPNGLAYSVAPSGSANEYRANDVEIDPTTDDGNGFAVTDLQPHEWLQYTIKVPAGGIYRIESRVATASDGSVFHIAFNGVSIGKQNFTNTGGTDNWVSLVKTVTLAAGEQIMRFSFDSSSSPDATAAINYIRIERDLSQGSQAAAFSSSVPLPTARQEAQGATLNGNYFVFGGRATDDNGDLTATTRVDDYDPASNSWSQMNDMPEAITHAAVVTVGAQAWLIGGSVGDGSGNATQHVWIYDSASDSWSAGPDLPAPRSGGAAGIINGLIYFTGGLNGTGDADQNTLWVYDTNHPELDWQSLSSLPVARHDLAAEVVNGKLYAIGGQQLADNGSSAVSEIDVYDPVNDSWSQATDAPLTLADVSQSTFVSSNKIIVLGGAGDPAATADQVLMYDPSANAWSFVGKLPEARGEMTVGLVGTQVIAAGGFTSSGPSASAWRGTLGPGSKSYSNFNPGAEWDDTSGQPIQAHGGGVLYQNGIYYWYGENKNTNTTTYNGHPRANVIGVSVYTSTDLYNWRYNGLALSGTSSGDLAPSGVLERPKVLFNAATGKYVMWMHIDNADYSKAMVGVAVSDSPLGPFVYQGSFYPLGLDSRDMTVFQDTDGSAYLVFSTDHNKSIRIAKMTPDYLALTGQAVQPYTTTDQREAPQLITHNGSYYLVTSKATWFDPNAAMYAVSSSVMGTYTIVGNPLTGSLASTTDNSQGTFLLQVAGTDNYIFMADRWNAADLGASRYVWLPTHFDGTKFSIDQSGTWDLSAFNP